MRPTRRPDPGARNPARLRRPAALAAAAAALAALAWVTWSVLADPGIAFLAPAPGAAWIVYPAPGNPSMHLKVESGALFRRSFDLAAVPARAGLRVRAFRRLQVAVNGQLVFESRDETAWKRERRADVARLLRPGRNLVEALVTERAGPPALWLRLDLPGRTLGTDARWEVSWAGATWEGAVRAGGPLRGHRYDPDRRIRSSPAALLAHGGAFLLLALLSGLAVALGRRLRGRGARLRRAAPWIAFAAAAGAWTALFANDDRWLSVLTGFDLGGHLDYIRYVLENHAVPLATQGWQMYQPPLYYGIAAFLVGAGHLPLPGPASMTALRALGLACGIANLALVGAALRVVFPGHPRRQWLGFAFATFLPMALYLHQVPTNETLAATLSTAVLLVTLLLLRAPAPSLRLHALLGLCVGLALLAKVSTLLVIVVAFGVLAARVVSGRRPRGGLAGLGAASAVALLVCGWYYARVWQRFGTPFVGNWEFRWWQDPGYRTPADYLRFSRALVSPLFAGFGGVWDGLYSTLWADGLCSGEGSIWAAPPWCNDWMAVAALLAILPNLAVLAGAGAMLAGWIRRPGLRDATLLGAGFLAAFAVVYMTLRLPYYGMEKSFYGLAGLLPLCAFAALGADLALSRARAAGAALLVLLGTWALASYGAMWIGPGSPRALAFRAETEFWKGAEPEGVALLRRALARDPGDWTARRTLAQYLTRKGARPPDILRLFEPTGGPDLVERHVALGQLAARTGDIDRAIAEARTVVAMDPDAPEGHVLRAATSEFRGDAAAAIAAWREVLRIDPLDAQAHESLARLLARAGAPDSLLHQDLAARLRGRPR